QSVLFDKIIWLGSRGNHKSAVLTEVLNRKIKIVIMPSVRRKVFNPLFVLLSYPLFFFYFIKYLPLATHVHTRAPSHPALLGIIFSFVDSKRSYWHKYAGNWVAASLPFTYLMQRKLLRHLNKRNVKITVNGEWDEANKQIISFENPCIS